MWSWRPESRWCRLIRVCSGRRCPACIHCLPRPEAFCEIRPGSGPARPEGEYNFGQLAILVLNYELRPLLANWHPALAHWESRRPADQSPAAHEEAWEYAGRLRWEIEQTRQRLVAYTDLFADAAGVPPLTGYATA